MNTIVVQGITVDFSGVTSDGWKWRGKVVLSNGVDTATANLDSFGDDVFFVDIEGDNSDFCLLIDKQAADYLEPAIYEALGDACSDEARRQAREEQEIDWSIDERRMGL